MRNKNSTKTAGEMPERDRIIGGQILAKVARAYKEGRVLCSPNGALLSLNLKAPEVKDLVNKAVEILIGDGSPKAFETLWEDFVKDRRTPALLIEGPGPVRTQA